MTGEVDLFGLYMPWLLPLGILALPLTAMLRRALAGSGLYRWVWHPALFDAALYLVTFGLLDALAGLLLKVA